MLQRKLSRFTVKVIFFLALTITMLDSYAQISMSKITTIKIGDTLPEAFWNYKVKSYEPAEKVKFDKFRNKPILIDFWGTYCIPCIQHLPHLQHLQDSFINEIKIILVTQEGENKVNDFFTRFSKQNGIKFTLPNVSNDTLLKTFFPHLTIPHYIWVGSNGKLVAITDENQVTIDNIRNFVEGKKVDFVLKEENIDFDGYAPLFVNGNGGYGSSIKFHSLLSGPIAGAPYMQSRISDKATRPISRLVGINLTITQLFQIAYTEAVNYPDSRIIYNVNNPIQLRWDSSYRKSKDEWHANNTYCYELITKPCTAVEIKQQMASDLERYLGLNARFETRTSDCYVLTALKDIDKIYSKSEESYIDFGDDGKYLVRMQKMPIGVLTDYLNRELSLFTINESKINQTLDIDLPIGKPDFSALQKALAKQGLKLTKDKREIKYFIISNKTQ